MTAKQNHAKYDEKVAELSQKVDQVTTTYDNMLL